MISKKDLAKQLQVCPRTITRWIKNKGLPVHRERLPTGVMHLRFCIDEVICWLDEQQEKKG